MVDKYSYCESIFASGYSPWHIRQLTDAGRKLGGGIDTASLCGLVNAGWDLEVPVREFESDHVCSRCFEVFKRSILDESD